MRQLLQANIEKRSNLYSPETNAVRLVHGEFDDCPRIFLDDYAGHWLLQSPVLLSPGTLGLVKQLAMEQGAQSLYWKRLNRHEDKESPQHLDGKQLDEPFAVLENGLKYWVDFGAGYSQGLFLDQRENRRRLRQITKGQSVLNTFAYTCSFSVAAAAAGAKTVSLDLSKPYLHWGQRNFALNDLPLENEDHDFIFGDVFDWMKRLAKRERRFDTIIIDPPTFSRNKQGKVFRANRDYPDLIKMACDLLTPEAGQLLCCTNQVALSEIDFEIMLEDGLALGNRSGTLHAQQMPPDFSGDTYLKNVWVDVRPIGVSPPNQCS